MELQWIAEKDVSAAQNTKFRLVIRTKSQYCSFAIYRHDDEYFL